MANTRRNRPNHAQGERAPVRLRQPATLTLESLVNGGEALGRVDGFPIFVPQGVPGDQVHATVISVKPGYARATIDLIQSPSPQRITAPCPVFGQCGGCQWQMIDYTAQVNWKTRLVADALTRQGGWTDLTRLRDTLASPAPWHYRNKVHWAAAKPDGSWRIGLYEPRSHHIVDIDDCAIQAPVNNVILTGIKGILKRLDIRPYDEHTETGDLRSIFAKTSQTTRDTMLGVVLKQDGWSGLNALRDAILAELPQVTTLVVNIHPEPGNKLLGRDTRVLFGPGVIRERLGPVELTISAQSFFQINHCMTEILYQEVAKAARCEQGPRVLDAYCGTGSIALYLAACGASDVKGLEIVPAAIQDARSNAEHNQLSARATFEVGDVGILLTRDANAYADFDVVVVDPPRKGCDEPTLNALTALQIPSLIYVSCNPVTLARDLRLLAARGYTTEYVQPVDMFPQTAHVECVARLVKS